jgi:hypothetical protein
MPKTNVKSAFEAQADPATLALSALSWILADSARATRMLALTGLTPDVLRDAVGERATLAATLAFLEAYEPDLIAAAEHIGTTPQTLVAARMDLEG